MTVDGKPAELGNEGAATWWLYEATAGKSQRLSLFSDEEAYAASLFGSFGFLFIAR